MAQINITLDQEEILQLLCDDRDEAFRQLLQNSLNSVLKAESAEQLKAAPYERSEKRTDSRNGTRQRKLALNPAAHGRISSCLCRSSASRMGISCRRIWIT